MRIAYLPDGTSANAAYRSIGPMLALARLGHEVRQLDATTIRGWEEALRWCDLLHVHRVCDDGAVELAHMARDVGVAFVWDDDDDVTLVPRRVSGQGHASGLKGSRRLAARAKLFRTVDLVTTPSAHLAASFREKGAGEVYVIENYVIDSIPTNRRSHHGVQLGWVAGKEHQLDVESIPVVPALERLLSAHPQLHITTIGVRLRLASDRYHHVSFVPFARLREYVSAFDIGIAPLSDEWAINQARSNIKLKEYASVGVPWLASPVGPYVEMGERQGGRLVPDDRWYEELDALIRGERARRKLAKRAAKWGQQQLLSTNVSCWERALTHALFRVRGRSGAPLSGA